jgi:anti-sigma B factor antagonist
MVVAMFRSLGDAVGRGPAVPRVSGEDGRTVVWLSGEYDVATLTVVATALARAIAVDDADLVVDLTELEFIDAATIGLLIRTRNFLGPRSRTLTVRNPPRFARRILDICGLAGLIDAAPADAGQGMGSPVAALSSWVPVPATDRAERGARRSAAAIGNAVVSVPDVRRRRVVAATVSVPGDVRAV